MSAPQLATGVHQLSIPCQDVPRATAFYRDGLGLPFLFDTEGNMMSFMQEKPA